MKSLKAVLLGLLTIGAFSAQAEYLLWQMDWADVADDADYATMVVLDSATGNEVATLNQATVPSTQTDPTKVYRDIDEDDNYVSDSTRVTSVVDGSYTNDNYSFALRTYDVDGNLKDTYGPAPYADISSSIWGGSLTPGVSTAWSPTKYAVPEPATGTLFIVGALMLFRRKRA